MSSKQDAKLDPRAAQHLDLNCTQPSLQSIQSVQPSATSADACEEEAHDTLVVRSLLTALPPELRAIIWHLSLPQSPPNHIIWTATTASQAALLESPTRKVWHGYLIPALFHVNRDARLATLTWMHSHGLQLRYRPAYFSMVQEFDPTRDFVYLTDDVFGRTRGATWMSGLWELEYNPPESPMGPAEPQYFLSSPIFQAQNVIVSDNVLPRIGMLLGNAPRFFRSLRTAHVLMEPPYQVNPSKSAIPHRDRLPLNRPRLRLLSVGGEEVEKAELSTKSTDQTLSLRAGVLERVRRLAKQQEEKGEIAPWAFCHLAEMDDWFEIISKDKLSEDVVA
ncbi:hypothetical protein LIA77_03887 [Sarocladium implicatum]|nr:hypothetical protein LIA77_03887 [Sarocladium implicatum]